MNQSKGKQWGAANEVAGKGHAARPAARRSLPLKETEEPSGCPPSNGGGGGSSEEDAAELAFWSDVSPPCFVKERVRRRRRGPDERGRLAKSNGACHGRRTRPTSQDAETKPASSSKNIPNPPNPTRPPKTNLCGLRRVLTYTHASLGKLSPGRPWTLEFDWCRRRGACLC